MKGTFNLGSNHSKHNLALAAVSIIIKEYMFLKTQQSKAACH
jgi:hypothetical protein